MSSFAKKTLEGCCSAVALGATGLRDLTGLLELWGDCPLGKHDRH
jgi:hypothetical protein